MARLSLFLPPFAGDYSGACSILFGMDCLVLVVDAGCCTRNYVEYDETRWPGGRKAPFSAQLRTLDALLGDDARIVEQAAQAARDLDVACTALVGTPVPALVGMDLPGMAREVEAASGIPAIGIATTGFETYEAGVSRALEALLRKFAIGTGRAATCRGLAGNLPGAMSDGSRCLRVNVLGASLQDFATGEMLHEMQDGLREAGMETAFSSATRFDVADIRAAADADASVVVSTAGLPAARLLQEACGVPFVACRPFAAEDYRALAERVQTVCLDAPSGRAERAAACAERRHGVRNLQGEAAGRLGGSLGAGDRTAAAGDGQAPVLLVGDQLAMNELRRHVRSALAETRRAVQVASFFAWEKSWSEPGDLHVANEQELDDWARAHPGAAYVGDPLLRRIPGLAEAAFFELPHEAVSSALYSDRAVCRKGEAVLEGVRRFAGNLA